MNRCFRRRSCIWKSSGATQGFINHYSSARHPHLPASRIIPHSVYRCRHTSDAHYFKGLWLTIASAYTRRLKQVHQVNLGQRLVGSSHMREADKGKFPSQIEENTHRTPTCLPAYCLLTHFDPSGTSVDRIGNNMDVFFFIYLFFYFGIPSTIRY